MALSPVPFSAGVTSYCVEELGLVVLDQIAGFFDVVGLPVVVHQRGCVDEKLDSVHDRSEDRVVSDRVEHKVRVAVVRCEPFQVLGAVQVVAGLIVGVVHERGDEGGGGHVEKVVFG